MFYDCKRIPSWIDRRLTGLARPDYDATVSFGLPFESEDCHYGKYRHSSLAFSLTPRVRTAVSRPDRVARKVRVQYVTESCIHQAVCQTGMEFSHRALGRHNRLPELDIAVVHDTAQLLIHPTAAPLSTEVVHNQHLRLLVNSNLRFRAVVLEARP